MAIIKFRRDTAADWAFVNPMLREAEPGYELDTGKFKIGDNLTLWNDLPYFQTGNAATDNGTAALLAHISSADPHPAFSEGPSLLLLYQNPKV